MMVFTADTSSGDQLFPLKNLFVATAWAKRGGIVVLYDGTYNPTYVSRKDLTIKVLREHCR
jgi:ribosomal protein S16